MWTSLSTQGAMRGRSLALWEKRCLFSIQGASGAPGARAFSLNRVTRTPDAAIRGFCRLIKALPPVERELWSTAKSRDFNIGVEAGTPPNNGEFIIAVETLKAACELEARIVFTVYARGTYQSSV